jgi:predicted DNA binding CopG/RHH family protein
LTPPIPSSKKEHHMTKSKKSKSKKSSVKRFNMEVSSTELRAMHAAAKAKGLTMSAWVRNVVRKAMI